MQSPGLRLDSLSPPPLVWVTLTSIVEPFSREKAQVLSCTYFFRRNLSTPLPFSPQPSVHLVGERNILLEKSPRGQNFPKGRRRCDSLAVWKRRTSKSDQIDSLRVGNATKSKNLKLKSTHQQNTCGVQFL